MEDELYHVLKDNAKEYYRNALIAHKNEEYNTSVTLFFKTISALADLLIYKNQNHIPKSHNHRFRILESDFKKVYQILDKNFSFYQNSYRSKLNEETSVMFKDDAKKLFGILEI